MGSIFSTYEETKAAEKKSKHSITKTTDESTKTNTIEIADDKMIDELAWRTAFSTDDVRKLFGEFAAIAKQSKNPQAIQRDQFCDILEKHGIRRGSGKSQDAYLARLFDFFDASDDGEINFKEYVAGLSVLSKGSPAEKFKLSFDIYDEDHSGTISKKNMLSVLTSLNRGAKISKVDSGASELPQPSKDIRDIVESVFASADKTKNGNLTYAEYFKAVTKHPWLIDGNLPGVKEKVDS